MGEVKSTEHDIAEPNADVITVVRYKASQFENVLIDDTSLLVEGVEVGVNVRWLLSKLDEFVGKRAEFVCLLAICRSGQVEIFEGRQLGHIVAPRGDSFGFNRYFLPDGATLTFGEAKPDHLNARYKAVKNFLAGHPLQVLPPLKEYVGAFQAKD